MWIVQQIRRGKWDVYYDHDPDVQRYSPYKFDTWKAAFDTAYEFASSAHLSAGDTPSPSGYCG